MKNKNFKFPHIGRVLIEDNVEIASGCTIDRGSVDETEIGKNTYLDNQVHIAHNVKIGSNCMIAGQVGVVGHIDICDDVRINGAAVVTKDINKPGIYSGSIPFENDRKWKKLVAKFKRSLKS